MIYGKQGVFITDASHWKNIMDRKEKQLEILFEIARIITSSLDIQLILENILKLLNTHLEMNRGTITLYDSDTESIKINIAYGLKENEKKRGEYRVGEGITGKVVKSGKAEIIPDISKDERFLDKTKAREDVIKKNIISFICVPIKVENNSIGALSIDKIFSNKARFEEDLRFLNIIASIIAQAIKLNNLVLNERMNLIDENINLKNQLKEKYNIGNIIGNSNGMKEVYHLIERVSDSNATVLICGESGTGKELVASAIHYNSKRSNGSFVKINCSAFPESILESELFGYEKGAFTGAIQQKKGKFEIANKGTILLDEIGEISKAVQVKLLRVIQFKEFERLGGNEVIKTDARIIVATNKNLEEQISKGNFREDFYYRINVFPIYVPPLRERIDDITMLADFFLEKYAKENNKNITRISMMAINLPTKSCPY